MGDSALARTTVKPVRADLYFSTERPSDSWKLEILDQWGLSSRDCSVVSSDSISPSSGLAVLILTVGFLTSSVELVVVVVVLVVVVVVVEVLGVEVVEVVEVEVVEVVVRGSM